MRTPVGLVTAALVAAILTALLLIASGARGESTPPFDRDSAATPNHER